MGTVPAAGKIMSNRLRRETDSSENPLSNVLGITVQPEQLQTAAAAKRRREPLPRVEPKAEPWVQPPTRESPEGAPEGRRHPFSWRCYETADSQKRMSPISFNSP